MEMDKDLCDKLFKLFKEYLLLLFLSSLIVLKEKDANANCTIITLSVTIAIFLICFSVGI